MPIYSDTRDVIIEVDLYQIVCDTCGDVYKRTRCGGYCTGDWHDEDCTCAESYGWKVDYLKEKVCCPQCQAQGKVGDGITVEYKCSNCWKQETLEPRIADFYGWETETDELFGETTVVSMLCPECAKTTNKEKNYGI